MSVNGRWRQTFGPSNLPGTCLYCGRTLRRGAYGGYFCTIDCGLEFAIIAARKGVRYRKIPPGGDHGQPACAPDPG